MPLRCDPVCMCAAGRVQGVSEGAAYHIAGRSQELAQGEIKPSSQ